MQDRWVSRASSLLATFQAVRGEEPAARSLVDRRTESFSQRWPGIVSRLNALEAAMLQDLTWWGPRMQSRLKQMTNTTTENRSDR